MMGNSPGLTVAAGEWTDAEIRVAIESYFVMWLLERAEAPYQKADHRRAACLLLPARSPKAVEFKWCNISAVLDESGLPFIVGYKPLAHYQERLRDLVAIWLLEHPYLRALQDR